MAHETTSILITGGAGYIGSHTVWALYEAGYNCVIVDNLSTGNAKLIPPSVPLIIADINNIQKINTVIKQYNVNSIIHFAASIVVPESIQAPSAYYQNNTVNTLSLIQLASECKLKAFIFSSTAAVYGETTNELVTELTSTYPINPYGTSKLLAEQMLTDIGQATKLPYVILRYFNVAGNDPKQRTGQAKEESTHLIQRACQTALGKYPEFTIFGNDYPTPDGTCIRDFIHVSDLAQAHVLALKYLLAGNSSSIFNCGYSHGYSVLEILENVKQLSGNDFPVQIASRRKGDAARVIADASKINQTLNWHPTYNDINFIINTTLEWEKNRDKFK